MKLDNKGKWIKKSLIGMAFFSCFIPFHEAKSEMKPLSNVYQNTIEVAQNYCPDGAGGMPMEHFFETDNFWIYICQGDQLYYYGVDKSNPENSITLPAYVEEGTGYIAVNGDYTYIVNGATLSIYEGERLLQEESVYQQ